MFAYRTLPVWIGVIPVLMICSGAAFAQTTWVVDQGGGGDFTGIQACIDDVNVMDGDTCRVNPGNYIENINYSGKAITVASSDGADVTVIDGAATGPVVTFETAEPSDSVLDGFIVRNGYQPTSQGGAGIHIVDAAPVVRNCVITENTGSIYPVAVDISVHLELPTDPHPIIDNCEIIDNLADGIVDAGAYGAVEILDSLIARNDGDGAVLWTNGSMVGCMVTDNTGIGIRASIGIEGTQCKIAGCYVANNGIGIWASAGATGGPIPYVTIKNTIATGNEVGLIGYQYRGVLNIFHCTIAGNVAELGMTYDGAGGTIANSIIWGDDTPSAALYDVVYSDVKGGHSGEGNINIDPGFAGADDFQLSGLSFCIDRGSVLYGVDEDYDGNVRPRGSGYDMGAYEYLPGGGWSVPQAQAAALYGTPKEVEGTSRINSLIALFFIPMGAVTVLRILSRKG